MRPFSIAILLSLACSLASCLKTTPPDATAPKPVREIVEWPGRPFSQILYGRINPSNDFFWADNSYDQPRYDGEGLLLVPAKHLIPAHQADVLVSLYLQEVYTEEIPDGCPESYAYAFFFIGGEGQPVAHFRFDPGCKLLSIGGEEKLFLNDEGHRRLANVIDEIYLRE